MDIDELERAGTAFARRVFKKRGEPKAVTLSERELGQMLAFAHQIGAAMGGAPLSVAFPEKTAADKPCLYTGVAPWPKSN